MEDACRKTQLSEYGALEQIAAGRAVQIVMTHIVASALQGTVLKRGGLSLGLGEIKEDHLWMRFSRYTDTGIIPGFYQLIIGVYKLQIFARRHLDASVPGFTEAHVALSDIGNLIVIFRQFVDSSDFRAIIHNDDFSLVSLE